MFAHPVLIADIGGTNSRFALATTPGKDPVIVNRLQTKDFPDPETAIRTVLADMKDKPRSAIVCVAGPVVDKRAHLTNASWTIDGPKLAKTFGFESGLLLNDFEAQALSLPALRPEWLKQIGEAAPALSAGPQVILGPGTGLGIGALLTIDGRYIPVASESCHIDFGPVGKDEEVFWPHLERVLGRVTTESVMSGPGLVRVHRARMLAKGQSIPPETGVEIVNKALSHPNSEERATVNA